VTIKGTISRIQYHNQANGYTVAIIELAPDEYKIVREKSRLIGNHITVVGVFDRAVFPEEEYQFEGNFVNSPRYGMQFQFTSFSRLEQTNEQGVINYLSSELFPGIGLLTAKSLVEALGVKVVEKIQEDETVLDALKLSKAQKRSLIEGIKNNANTQAMMLFLMNNGITIDMAHKIIAILGSNALEKIKAMPYCLMQAVPRFGFNKNDAFALRIGVEKTAPVRIKAVIQYVLNEWIFNSGNSYIETQELFRLVNKYLNGELEYNLYRQMIDELSKEGSIIYHRNNLIFDAQLYQQEITLAKQVAMRIKNEQQLIESFDSAQIKRYLDNFESESGINFDNDQRTAIIHALSEPISIITGGPGTGKTTIVRAIIYLYLKLQNNNTTWLDQIALVAPTGRAAKRLKETTGIDAQTIHKFLGYQGDNHFTRGPDNPTHQQLIIVDEASMMDLPIAYRLFVSLDERARVIIVGDVDQLPAVGPGQVLKDLIDTKEITTVRLRTIHRQAEGSNIILFAHALNDGRLVENILEPKVDRVFWECEEVLATQEIIKQVELAKSKGLDIIRDIQVLIPMYRGEVGINAINDQIQALVNPLAHGSKEEIKYNGQIFRVNDKVIQLVNRSEKNVMNGDIGIIMNYLYKDKAINGVNVLFDTGFVEYTWEEMEDLKLAYAISVHKSQGSEFDTVIVPFVTEHRFMLRRKLIYTAVTRAKKHLVMLGNLQRLYYGINRIEDPRQTILAQKIVEAIQNKKILIDDAQSAFSTLGEKSFGNNNPYDFEP